MPALERSQVKVPCGPGEEMDAYFTRPADSIAGPTCIPIQAPATRFSTVTGSTASIPRRTQLPAKGRAHFCTMRCAS